MTELIPQQRFRQLADVAISAAGGKDVLLQLSDQRGGATRFANNQVTQNVNTRRQSLSVRVAEGQRRGGVWTTELSESGVRAAVAAAEEIARVAPEDPEYLPPLPPQKYPLLATWRPETAAYGPAQRIVAARTAVELCQSAGMQAAGLIEAFAEHSGVAASSGLFAFEGRTRAQFTLTATASDSTGWAGNASRSTEDLDVAGLTRQAIEKARRSASPTDLPAGRYTVILEPAAVLGLLGPLIQDLAAKGYYRQTSAVAGKLGERLIDARLSLQNRPDHPSLLGAAFNEFGLPADWQTWIEGGVLRRLSFDRFTAQEHGQAPSFELDAPLLAGQPADAADTLDELVAATPRAVLVTNFWYIRGVNPSDLTLTGMTRDGTFLIEDGKRTAGTLNFRWHDSPLRVLNAVTGYTRPLDAITWERSKTMAPALRVADFHFSSVTRF